MPQEGIMASVLFIVTSHARLGATGKATGLWLEELAAPWFAVRDAGHRAVLASPKGGPVPIDPASEAEPPGSVQRFRADAEAMRTLEHALPLAGLDWRDYDAIFMPGGHGTMWDLPGDAALARLVSASFAAGRPLAAVCHGPAGLIEATVDGRPLVAGRRLACFTNAEERAVGLVEVVPFLLADRLQALGAQLSAAADFQPHAVRDGLLISGQNPASSEPAAQLLLAALAESSPTR
jgi:putative intracellular protease/amidase